MSAVTIYEKGRNGWRRRWYPTHGEGEIPPEEMAEILKEAAVTGFRDRNAITLRTRDGKVEQSFEVSPLHGDRVVDERTAKLARTLLPDLEEIIVVLIPPTP